MLVRLEPHASTLASGERDVVVRRETRDGIVVHILRTAPGADQYLLHSEEAVVQGESIGITRERPVPGGLRPARR
jgi:hypothetical protein